MSGAGPLFTAVARHAAAHPDKPAIVGDGARLTYTQLCAATKAKAAGRMGDGNTWHVIDTDNRVDFIVEYLACSLSRVPVVVSPPTGIPENLTAIFSRPVAGPVTAAASHPEVVFTSGSVSQGKAVLLDADAMAGKAADLAHFVGNDADDVEVVFMPLFHSFGLGRLRSALVTGQTIALTGGLVARKTLFHTFGQWERVGFGCVSSVAKVLLSMYGGPLSRYRDAIRYVELGSEPFDPSSRSALRSALPDTRLSLHYGMTEVSRAAMIRLDQENGDRASAGYPMPKVEVGVRDLRDDSITRHGEGEVLLRGDAMLYGYVESDRIRLIDRGGWVRTGDHGEVDQAGEVTVRGRLSNSVKVLGTWVFPEETEAAIRAVEPSIVCVCVPAAHVGGTVALVAVIESSDSSPDPTDLHRKLEHSLPREQLPQRFVNVPNIPRLGNGKVDRLAIAQIV